MRVNLEGASRLDCMDASEPEAGGVGCVCFTAVIRRSFDELYLAEFQRVFRMAYLVGGDRRAAEDAAQEAFTRALERWERLRGQPWAAGWVAKTAIRLVRRSAGRRVEQLPPVEERSSAGRDPGPRLDLRLDLWRAIKRLPMRQQQAVVLRYVFDLPVEDVGASHGLCSGHREGASLQGEASPGQGSGRFRDMTLEDEDIMTLLRALMDRVPAPAPDLADIVRRTRARRMRRGLAGAFASAAVLAVFMLSIAVLLPLVRQERRMGSREPGAGPAVESFDVAQGSGLAAVAVSATSERLWIGLSGGCSGTVVAVDPWTLDPIGRVAFDVVSDLDAQGDAVWVAAARCTPEGTRPVAIRVDEQTTQPISEVELPCPGTACHASNIIVGSDGVWATVGWESQEGPRGAVVHIDATTGTILSKVPVNGWPRDLVRTSDALWVFVDSRFSDSVVDAASVVKVDPREHRVEAVLLRDELPPGGGELRPPELTAGDGYVWVHAEEEGRGVVLRLDEANGEIVGPSVPVRDVLGPFAVAEGAVWLLTGDPKTGERTVTWVDPDTSTLLGRVRIDETGSDWRFPLDAVVDPMHGTVWIVDHGGSITRVRMVIPSPPPPRPPVDRVQARDVAR